MHYRLWTRCLGLGMVLMITAGCSAQSPTRPDPIGAAALIGGTTLRGPAAASPQLAEPSNVSAQGVQVSSSPPPWVFPAACCYYNGMIVRTVVPPAANPRMGRDNFYDITNGVDGQIAIVGVIPGDTDYHGGQWKFHAVSFVDGPYLLTSESAVRDALAAGDVTVTRIAENDFKCPIQP